MKHKGQLSLRNSLGFRSRQILFLVSSIMPSDFSVEQKIQTYRMRQFYGPIAALLLLILFFVIIPNRNPATTNLGYYQKLCVILFVAVLPCIAIDEHSIRKLRKIDIKENHEA